MSDKTISKNEFWNFMKKNRIRIIEASIYGAFIGVVFGIAMYVAYIILFNVESQELRIHTYSNIVIPEMLLLSVVASVVRIVKIIREYLNQKP